MPSYLKPTSLLDFVEAMIDKDPAMLSKAAQVALTPMTGFLRDALKNRSPSQLAMIGQLLLEQGTFTQTDLDTFNELVGELTVEHTPPGS